MISIFKWQCITQWHNRELKMTATTTQYVLKTHQNEGHKQAHTNNLDRVANAKSQQGRNNDSEDTQANRKNKGERILLRKTFEPAQSECWSKKSYSLYEYAAFMVVR